MLFNFETESCYVAQVSLELGDSSNYPVLASEVPGITAMLYSAWLNVNFVVIYQELHSVLEIMANETEIFMEFIF
jgi:hypothetical protein